MMQFAKKAFTVSVVVATIFWAVGLAAFVPVGATAAVAGDLIKRADNSAVYYYGSDGMRHPFPNSAIYFSWYSDFSGVQTLSADALAAINIGKNVTVRPGTKLVKITTDPKVYAVEGKNVRHIDSEARAQKLFGANWGSRVIDLSDAFFASDYAYGSAVSSDVHPDGTLVSYEGNSSIYLISGGKKRMFSNMDAFNANKYKLSDVVVSPASITYADGDAITGMESGLTDVSMGGTTTTTGGSLMVSVASDTPAAASVATNGNANFTKIKLQNTGSTDVSLTKLNVMRYGLSSNSDVENLKVTDMNGKYLGGTSSFNSDSKAAIYFSPALTLTAGSTNYYYIRASVDGAATAGKTAALGLDAASDVVAGGASVSGAFPVKGNEMSVVSLTIATVTVDQDSATADSTPDAGEENVIVNKFKVDNNSIETVTIESLTVMEAGSASNSDTKNIELYDVTDGKSLGEMATWDSNGRAHFSGLNLVLEKGETHRFQVRLDIVSGSGNTVNADIIDGSDILMNVKGNTYGFYITPTNGGSWGNSNAGRGSSDQTINSGSLVVTKASSTPATGNVSRGDAQLLGVWTFEAKGEPVKISALDIDFSFGTMTYTELTNLKLYDENGLLVAGPNDADSGNDVNFSDTFIVPVGQHNYTLKGKVATSTSTGDTVTPAVDRPGTTITAVGQNTGDSITPTPAADVTVNQQSVAAASLSATTLAQPAARQVSPGISDLVFMTGSLNAASSGEDVRVETVVIENTLNAAGDDADMVQNGALWADLTSANSARGDKFETRVSEYKTFVDSGATDEKLTYTLTSPVVVKKGTYVEVAFVASISASATTNDTYTISFDGDAGDVTGTGADTGAAVSVTPTGDGQTMSLTANGTLTTSVDSSSPSAALLQGGASKVTTAVFRLAADGVESLDLDSFLITDEGSDTVAGTYYLYSSARSDGGSVSDPIASMPGAATANFIIPDGTVTIPANGYVLITVKADLNAAGTGGVANDSVLTVTVDAAGDIDTTGLASGAGVDSTGTNYDAAAHQFYKSFPTITVASDSPSGVLPLGATTNVAKFNVTAASGDDITFENADGNTLTIQISIVRGDDAGAADDDLYLYDGTGTLLDTIANVDFDDTTSHQFDFTSANFTVPAGQTKSLVVKAFTTEFEDSGDAFQVWINDAANDIDWGINGTGSYNEGAIILKGEIYANNLYKL